MLDLSMVVLLVLGTGVGLILALTGAGGAIIAVPALMFGMGWSVAEAGPVALLAVACSATVGAVIGLRTKNVRYRAAMLVALCGMPMTPLGMGLAHLLPPTLMTILLAGLLLLIAAKSLRRDSPDASLAPGGLPECPGAPCLLNAHTGRLQWTGRCGSALAMTGLGTGLLSGLFGVGGGFFIVPALRRLTDLSMNAAIATSMLIIAFVASGGAITAALSGHLPIRSAAPFAFGAIGGMAVGRLIAGRVAGAWLSRAFALTCVSIALLLLGRTIYEALHLLSRL